MLLLSSVHTTNDPRIVHKLVPTLASHYRVVCVLPNALSSYFPDSCRVISIPSFQWIGWRILFCYPLILWKYLRIRPSVVHIFVAELLPIAFLFHLAGSKVIYEVQENLYKKLHLKQRNNHWLFQKCFRFFDRLARTYFHFVFTEEAYRSEYKFLRKNSVVIHNYSSIEFLSTKVVERSSIPCFVYMGVITLDRGLDTLVQATLLLQQQYNDFEIHLYGHLRTQPITIEGFDTVKAYFHFHPYTDYPVLFHEGAKFWAGLALLQPVGDYTDSYPSKLFDYMAMGIPVITSNFPLYEAVIVRHNCGIVISPSDAGALYETMVWIIAHREQAIMMGKRGQIAVTASYNWEQEAEALLSFYQDICP